MPYCTSYFKFLSAWLWGFPEQNKDFAITTYGGGGDQSLIRYFSKTAEQNFMKLSGIVHYMIPYCTSYFKFLSARFWGFPEQNKDFVITTYGGGGPSPIRYSSKTAEQNFMKLANALQKISNDERHKKRWHSIDEKEVFVDSIPLSF